MQSQSAALWIAGPREGRLNQPLVLGCRALAAKTEVKLDRTLRRADLHQQAVVAFRQLRCESIGIDTERAAVGAAIDGLAVE